MSDEELRLEVAKLAVQCFVASNGSRYRNSFNEYAKVLHDYIKNGAMPNTRTESDK